MEYKLKQSRGSFSEDSNVPLLRFNDIPERATTLQKIFDDRNKPTPSKSSTSKVGKIEKDDWNVKVWDERAKGL